MRQLGVMAAILAAFLTMAAAPAGQTPAQILAAAPLEQRIADLERRAQEKTDIERRDLYAQEAMASSAQEMAALTMAQIALTVLGTIGLFWSLSVTRGALKLAREDIALTRDMARPQFIVTMFRFEDLPDSVFRFTYVLKNVGQTNATGITWDAGMEFVEGVPAAHAIATPRSPEMQAGDIASQGERHLTSVWRGMLPENPATIFRERRGALALSVRVRYQDIFGRKHTFNIDEIRTAANLTENRRNGEV